MPLWFQTFLFFEVNGANKMFNESSHEDLGKLLVKASQGDTEAFEKLYSATASAQYYLALKHTKDESLAADVVQELYIKLFKYMDKIENPRLFVAYLNRMNYTISMDLVKKYKREISTDFSESENDFVDPRSIHPKENIDQNLVSMALNELDDSLRDVVVMRYINKMKIDDIAEYLKVSKRTVSRMLSKGIEQLRKECKRLKNFSFSLGFFLTPTSPWILKSIADSAMPKELYSEVFTNACRHVYGLSGVVATPLAATASTSFFRSVFKREAINTFTIVGGSTVIVAGALVVGLAAPEFNIKTLTEGEYTNTYMEYSIEELSAIPIKQVSLYNEQGDLIASEPIDNGHSLKITENGVYTVVATGVNNQKDKQTLVVTQIDTISPSIDVFDYGKGGNTKIIVSDQDSKLNFDSIEVYTLDNKQIPFKLTVNDSTEGEITFTTTVNTDIVIEDNASNKIIGHIKID